MAQAPTLSSEPHSRGSPATARRPFSVYLAALVLLGGVLAARIARCQKSAGCRVCIDARHLSAAKDPYSVATFFKILSVRSLAATLHSTCPCGGVDRGRADRARDRVHDMGSR